MIKTINFLGGYLSMICFFLFGSDPTNLNWLYILIGCMILDIICGLYEPIKTKTFKYSLLFDGLFRKMQMLFAIVIAHFLDTMEILNGDLLQKIVTGFLIGYEATSVLNHIKLNGSPIPQKLWDALKNLTSGFGSTTK